ncbi:MAG: hypothetical protein IH855_06785 [Bacteroidetes bacterium]|nr:hypothetical protein [Bacteroidota bacterium]
MLRFPALRSAALIALVLTLAAAPAVSAQNATGERVLRSWTDDVKLDDGSQALWTFTVTFNTDTGEYARTVTDKNGTLIERTVQATSLARPTDEEIEMARAIIFADPDLNELYERANNPELSGGFVLQREEGHPCGPGSRCLQFDMFDVDTAARRVNRIRYVVVDVRDGTLVSKDFDPSADGNATRFNRNPDPTR